MRTVTLVSSGRFSYSVLVLALLLRYVCLSNLSVTISATKYNVMEMAELRRSMSRYRQLVVREPENTMRDLLQADENKIEEQGDDEREAVVRADAKVEELERPTEESLNEDLNENPRLDQQQQGGLAKAVVHESKSDERPQQQRGLEKVVEHESNSEEQQQQGEEQKGEEQESIEKEEVPFVFPEPYLLGPTITDWDEQRGGWLEANPHMKSKPDGKPRVLMVTGSQPEPCASPIGDNFHVKSLKLKIDYARMHNYEIFYNLAWLDPLFGSYWVKLPILRKLMLTHPEIEWFFWVDSDAVFTDMLFEAPFDTYEGYNMIMWGIEYGLYTDKSWVSFNAGVFLLRNCQWSLDLIDKWSPMGPKGPVRDEFGKILTAFLTFRKDNFSADDQSALAYLMITDEAVKSKVKLIDSSSYMFSGWWLEVVDTYETCLENYHPGLGDKRWPWVTHFTGCGPCAGGDNPDYSYEKCMATFDRAYNFADNQVLAYMGYQHESLSSQAVVRTRNETDRPLEFVGVNPWEERISQVAA